MIYTVYLNPTIDKTVYLNEFHYGKTNRPYRSLEDGAGKAINVAVVLKELGYDVTCIGLLYSTDGEIIQNRLEEHGIHYQFLETEGRSRINMKIFDDSKKVVTEINEKGSRVEEKKLQHIANKILAAVKNKDTVFLSGSLPEGCDPSFYADLITSLNCKGARCILDADGQALTMGIQARPYYIKPNRDELQSLYNLDNLEFDEIAWLAQKIVREGIPYVMVSLGIEGAFLAGNNEVYYAMSPEIDVKSTVGAGDSMIAASALLLESDMEAALKSGVAAAGASIMQEGTQLLNVDDYTRLLEKIKVKKIL